MSDDFNGHALRVFGPPGTGKTTDLSRRTGELISEYGPQAVMIASFSVTAAKEIASRFATGGQGIRPPDKAIGTLHSHAYRALGWGKVALDSKVIGDWNDQHPQWTITPDGRRDGGSNGGGGHVSDPNMAQSGDELISCLDRYRATLTPREDWAPNVREFADRWTDWKRDAEALDFSDMTEGALAQALDGEPAPGKPQFLIVDEAQDMTPLEVALACAWGEKADQLIIGMDDDQAINRWRGGDPEPLLNLAAGPEGLVEDVVLDQSYRVPEAVRAAAALFVRRVSHRRDKRYQARLDEAGQVVHGTAHTVSHTLNSTSLLDAVEADLDTGQTVMIIASCNYMLHPLITGLRERGITFHNPYRPSEMAWNPLGGSSNGVSTAERVFRYMIMDESLVDHGGRLWTGGDVQHWIELIKLNDAGMKRGAKKMAALFDVDAEVPFEEISMLFNDPAALEQAVEPSLEWLSSSLLAGKAKVASYPITVARQRGPAAIAEKPRLTIGTIHSVKGGQSDIVYVAPDISAAGQASAVRGQSGRDELVRLFYVAMTRAKSALRLLESSAPNYVNQRDLIPAGMEVR